MPFLCHYSLQLPLIISESFYNTINAEDRTFLSMLRVCQYGILKRIKEVDVQTLIPCFEAFTQLVLISQQIVGVENCKLKNVNCEVFDNGLLFNLMRQEGTEKTARNIPIVIE